MRAGAESRKHESWAPLEDSCRSLCPAAALLALAWPLVIAGCAEELRIHPGDGAVLAVGTGELHCLAGVGQGDEGPGGMTYSSSAPDVAALSGANSVCVWVEALSEGEATITLTTNIGVAKEKIRVRRATHVTLAHHWGALEDPAPIDVDTSYAPGTFLDVTFVCLADGDLLRGHPWTGFSLTDPTVVQLRPGTLEVGGIEFLAPGASQVLWQGLPGPVFNVSARANDGG